MTHRFDGTLTDRHGRTPEDRIAAVQRFGTLPTEQQKDDAAALLADMLRAAKKYGVTFEDFDNVLDLPGGCLDVITATGRRDTAKSIT